MHVGGLLSIAAVTGGKGLPFKSVTTKMPEPVMPGVVVLDGGLFELGQFVDPQFAWTYVLVPSVLITYPAELQYLIHKFSPFGPFSKLHCVCGLLNGSGSGQHSHVLPTHGALHSHSHAHGHGHSQLQLQLQAHCQIQLLLNTSQLHGQTMSFPLRISLHSH